MLGIYCIGYLDGADMPVRGRYLPSSYDPRDIYIDSSDRINVSQVYLYRPPVKNQEKELECCTSMAVTTALEILGNKDGGRITLSPLFHYFYSRANYRYFGGVTLRHALKTATKMGVCKLEHHDVAYTREGALIIPDLVARKDGVKQRIIPYDPFTRTAGYWRADGVNRVNKWRTTLGKGYPIIAGFWTQKSYWQGEGLLESELEEPSSAHAVCIIGYNNDKGCFIAADSRGKDFANEGEWPLSYEVANSDRIVESWTLSKISFNH